MLSLPTSGIGVDANDAQQLRFECVPTERPRESRRVRRIAREIDCLGTLSGMRLQQQTCGPPPVPYHRRSVRLDDVAGAGVLRLRTPMVPPGLDIYPTCAAVLGLNDIPLYAPQSRTVSVLDFPKLNSTELRCY